MIIFWILSAGLMTLALFFVALPLLRPETPAEAPAQDELNLLVFKQRLQELDNDLAAGFLEQDQYAAARRDLERDLLRDIPGDAIGASPRDGSRGRWLALVLAVAVPAAAVTLYNQVGHRDIIERMESAARGETAPALVGPDGEQLPPLEVLVARLEERMAQDASNVDGWLMLGRTYFTMRRPDEALAAVSKAYALAPERADVTLAYAETLAANNGNRLEGKPAELIEQVLTIEPDNASARWLAGMLYYQRGQYTAAATAWQGILDGLDPGSSDAQEMREMIAEARTRAGAPAPSESATAESATAGARTPRGGESSDPPASDGSLASSTAAPVEPATPPQGAGSASIAAASVTAEVSLDQGLSGEAAPEDIVFVFARAVGGPPMPLAVRRLQVKDLPTEVTLDDSMAMMPAMRLSAFPRVIVGARVAKNGQATPQAGDLEGEVGPIDSAGNARIALRIDRVRP